MIRANLLPRPNERVSVFGLSIPLDALRAVLLSVGFLVAVAGITYALESYRAASLSAAAAKDEALLDEHAMERAQVRTIAVRVAALRVVDRVAREAARSGNDSALDIARIGNALPFDVWLDRLDHQDRNYGVGGRSQTLADVGTAVIALGRAMPDRDPVLLGVDGTAHSVLHFSAQLQERARR